MSVWFVNSVDIQRGCSCHQQDKQALEGCLCTQEGQIVVY